MLLTLGTTVVGATRFVTAGGRVLATAGLIIGRFTFDCGRGLTVADRLGRFDRHRRRKVDGSRFGTHRDPVGIQNAIDEFGFL
ncbi:hypothetical protein BMS3Bbin01_02463 [bacterium BMS3Bbin01]|nr:hypothetical protein BMS3Bbin01_02463 [bacterium BMS3Bbin01]